ncbi:hypothetical protein Phum_PHUM200880 [Pediculus humanus corporis]|uniref:Uncharacterized protein n=1 Tax=Pediculus humanus subsp. corporis TaxID=121224 RepID=E0VH48_PEDHC|nr:uncharacterized protein Phum_PHUM200880 [Pediculus humanus corporis]EEB12704.1 hypothetical protein Phum_PHUM200880 [Pediculus humanus corporis]
MGKSSFFLFWKINVKKKKKYFIYILLAITIIPNFFPISAKDKKKLMLLVRFHPGSPQDNHLVILTSNNTLRLYQLPLSDGMGTEKSSAPEFIRTWFLGQRSTTDGKEWNLSGSKLPFLVGLGEMAVDFDFALPIVEIFQRRNQNL